MLDAQAARLAGNTPDGATAALQALSGIASANDAAATSPALLAEFCLVAGQAMRRAPDGTGRETKLVLLSAWRHADVAKDPRLASRTALELGFAAAAEAPASAGTGKRGANDSADALAAEAMAACAPDLAQLLGRAADYFTAATALECAVAVAQAGGDDRTAAIANLRLARLSLAYSNRDRVIADMLRAGAAERLFASLEAALRLAGGEEIALRAAETLLSGGTRDPRLDAALDRLAATTGRRPGLVAWRLALLARAAGLRGDGAAQRALLSRAIFQEMQERRPMRLATWYADLAEAEPARRGAHIAAAYRALENVRAFLPQFDPVTQESIFQLSMRPIFEAAAESELAAGGTDAQAIDRAQTIIERFRQAELQNVFGSECVPARDPLRPADLSPGEMMLYPVLLPDCVELLWATAKTGGFKRLVSPETSGRAEVAQLVEAFVRASSTGGEGWREPARRLYDVLVRPVLAMAGDTQLLVIVPDGPLRSLPFAALVDESGRHLIERAQIVVTPALGYAAPGDARRGAPAVLALALAREVELPAGVFPKLDGTIEEARAAAGPDGTMIPDFRKADLDRAMAGKPFDVLHLSTHASFEGRAERAFIVANGEAIRLSELREMIADTQVRGQELDLLVLGACETAVGDDQASMGLAGAAVQAGAQSAIASLWQVNDLGTVKLMQALYDNLRQGRSKPAALQAAQVAMIRSGAEFADPNIWSAFILLGGWR